LHTLLPEQAQFTEPQALLTVLLQAPLQVGKVQHVLLVASQALPLPQLAEHTLLPQLFVTVTPQAPLHTGSAQQVLLVVSQALPLPQEVTEQSRVPHVFVSFTLHCPLHTGRSQHVPLTDPVGLLHVLAPQPQKIVLPQPSSSVPH
jgi:hypothetical protein